MTEDRRRYDTELPTRAIVLNDIAQRIFSQFPVEANQLRNLAKSIERDDSGHVLTERRNAPNAGPPEEGVEQIRLLMHCTHCNWTGPIEEIQGPDEDYGYCPQCSFDESALEPYLGPMKPAVCSCGCPIFMDADAGQWLHYQGHGRAQAGRHGARRGCECPHAHPTMHPSATEMTPEEGLRLVREFKRQMFTGEGR